MSDPNTTSGPASLGEALRALPLATPARDGWSALAAQLAPALPPRRRYSVPLAVAAACLLAIAALLSVRHAPSGTPSTARGTATVAPAAASSSTNGAYVAGAADMANATNIQTRQDSSARLSAAQARSQSLERWLRDTRGAASPLPSQDLAAATEIENLIGLVDVELAASPQNGTLVLWQRRVALLEDLTALRYSNYRLAENANAMPAANTLNRIN